jgi:hypothetical protein
MTEEITRTEDPTAPPASTPPEAHMVPQDQVDRIVQERLSRERQKFADYDDLKAKATQFDELDAASKSDLDKAIARAEAAEASVAEVTTQAIETKKESAIIAAAAAAGAIDPGDFMNLKNAVTVGDDGQVTGAEEAVKGLIESKPYLVGQTLAPQGAADGGPRSSGTGPKQLTRDDLSSMKPEEIEAARTAGQLDQLLGRQ